mmetsp:Transcript_5010/g.12726  ORF Transcript_5010/g.12726 Transcript_5010/m.12726 type:complete len:260 (+) Transcript_5010:160-939(+)|eukprot:CAMPEP_0197575932 /NCGR_PEP_ID=MMETSP1326-20131121/1132_1 /TAXON_ID=1155430 /ORGANISM="Genus nov. species nov., Strain RCC2288" /LENGTH=259 /DNA_ID=CAMNT_0043138765 /DNA_START=173 /DNA_END=952 /DNA_ORIENTATION=-
MASSLASSSVTLSFAGARKAAGVSQSRVVVGVAAPRGLSARSAVMGSPVVAQRAAQRRGSVCMAITAGKSGKASSGSGGRSPRGNSGGSRKGLMAYVERVMAMQMKDDLIPFRVGMTCKVGVTVKEGAKTRVQPYEGIIIAIHRSGVATTITVRKAFGGYGVERIFPVHSPLCSFEEIRGAGKVVVRRAKLYYLRDLVGKKAKLKTRFVAKKVGATRFEVKMEALKATKAAAAEVVAAAAAAAEAAAAAPAAEEAVATA